MSSSSFFKSSGTSVTLQNTVDQLVTDAETAKAAAETAATNAASSASLSSTYANNSNTSATNAAASLTSAQSAQSAAETAETNAETAQTAAETAETNAASSASTASTQASNASTSATNAASSASTATTKASEASTSATNAATSETNAATSATNAASSATTASGHASTASTQASNASTSATNAASSASAASTSETNAATSESNASTSATNAATSASTASTQATNASNSATAAATSATNAASSATSAASSASTAQTLSDDFGEKYRIASTAPTTSLDVGDLYFDTTQNELKVYKSSGWAAAGSTVNGTSARFHYDITGTPTSVSGADANGNTLAYDAGYVDVYVNGVRMSDADITITSGNTITFTEALSNGDEVDIVAYGTFVATVLNADNLDSGTVPNARITGAYTGITNLTMSGDLTVDTNTLIANSSTNSVGIGTTYAVGRLNVLAQSNSEGINVLGRSSDERSRINLKSNDGSTLYSQWDYSGTSVDFKAVTNIPLTFHTNATERMRIDSNGNVLVGGTSFNNGAFGGTSKGINVAGTQPIVLLHETDTDKDGYLGIANSIFRLTTADSIPITFATNDIERMRIDSSGNLLVGKSSSNFSTAGIELNQNGVAGKSFFARSGGEPISLNRLSSDGDILTFYKDSSIAGSIGTDTDGEFIIHGTQSSTSGLKFDVLKITPVAANGTDADGTRDLGSTGVRFKDLYLSGGVYIGGTGSANYLDDYEEGTFDPIYLGATSNPSVTYDTTVRYGAYTKIGRICYFNLVIRTDAVSSTGSGQLRVGGLPFTSSNAFCTATRYQVSIGRATNFNNARSDIVGEIEVSSTYIQIYYNHGSTSFGTSELNNGNNFNQMEISGFYVV